MSASGVILSVAVGGVQVTVALVCAFTTDWLISPGQLLTVGGVVSGIAVNKKNIKRTINLNFHDSFIQF